jgi:hypothetical protein
LHFWAAKSISEIVRNNGGHWNITDDKEIVTWAIETSREKTVARQGPAIRQLSLVVTYVMKGAGLNRKDCISLE